MKVLCKQFEITLGLFLHKQLAELQKMKNTPGKHNKESRLFYRI